MRPGQRRRRGVDERREGQAQRGHPEFVRAGQLAAGHHRADRVAQRGAQHLEHRPAGPTRGDAPAEEGDARQADGEPGPAGRGQPLAVAGQPGHAHPDDRNRRDEQPAQRAGQAALRAGQQQPGQDDLDGRENGHPAQVGPQRAESAAADRDRQQQERADEHPREDQDGHADAAVGDLDQQVGDAPDDAQGHEQGPAAAAHEITPTMCILGRLEASRVTDKRQSGSRSVVQFGTSGQDPQGRRARSSSWSRSRASGTRQQYSRYSAAQASTTAAASVIAAASASWRGIEASSEPLR